MLKLFGNLLLLLWGVGVGEVHLVSLMVVRQIERLMFHKKHVTLPHIQMQMVVLAAQAMSAIDLLIMTVDVGAKSCRR
jgi:hypothetical protein